MGSFISLFRVLRAPEMLVLPLTVVVVLAVEIGLDLHLRKFDQKGPIANYAVAAIHAARDRVHAKLRAAEGNPAAASQPAAASAAALPAAPPSVIAINPPTPPASGGDRNPNYADEHLNHGVSIEQDMSKLVAPEQFDDPFVKKLPDGAYIPHPLLSYVGVTSKYPFKKDYFGMRNDEDVYFGNYAPDKRCQILFTWSGNSEAAGFTHKRTVAQYLEKELNERDPAHVYKSLSLAVNGYALNDEILAYVSLAYALKPEFAITHSGITDIVYGGAVEGGFKETGLIYTFDALDRWVFDIYGIPIVPNLHPNARLLQPSHMNDLVPGIIKTYDRYRGIVEGNGGEFIVGLAPYGVPSGQNASAYWSKWAPQELEKLDKALPPGEFIDFTKLKDVEFNDTIHTTDKTARRYADIYASEILTRMKTIRLSPLRKGAPGYDGRPCKMPVELD